MTTWKETKSVRSRSVRRVALVLSQLRPGGAERVVCHLADELGRRGVEPLVVCIQEEGELAAELQLRDVQVVALRSMTSYDAAAICRLVHRLRRFRPDVINVHDYSSLPYTALATLALPRRPIVFTSHGLLYEGFETLQRRHRFFARRISTIVAVSREVRDRHVDYLNWRGGTHIVPNGVPAIHRSLEDRRNVREELGIPDDEFVFLAVGNPRPEKAFEDLIAASSKVQRHSATRPFSTLIVGRLSQNEYCDRLRQNSQKSGIRGLRLLGYRSDIHRLYSMADAFVLSSRSEGLPLAVLEAMMAGLPVVATRVGGVPQSVPSGGGLLVEPGRPEQLADAMRHVMSLEDGEFARMGRVAQAWATSEFGVTRMVQRYLDVYRGEAARQKSKGAK